MVLGSLLIFVGVSVDLCWSICRPRIYRSGSRGADVGRNMRRCCLRSANSLSDSASQGRQVHCRKTLFAIRLSFRFQAPETTRLSDGRPSHQTGGKVHIRMRQAEAVLYPEISRSWL
jgi:hypothetical protein